MFKDGSTKWIFSKSDRIQNLTPLCYFKTYYYPYFLWTYFFSYAKFWNYEFLVFWDKKNAWIVIHVFAQTCLIWNIFKNWHIGYISHLVFISGHEFVFEIENNNQIWNSKITLVPNLQRSREFQNFYLIRFFNFDSKFAFSGENWVEI